MAAFERPAAYTFIPPPPLPEFYLPKVVSGDEKSSSSSPTITKDHKQALVPAHKTVKATPRTPFPQPVGPVLQLPGTAIEPNGYISLPRKYPPMPGDGVDETASHHCSHRSHHRSRTAEMPRAPSAPVITIPPPRPTYAYNPYMAAQPLAVYHICRICLRPRSARFHREHPIPINGLPPPPGICRRCRIMSVEETTPHVRYVNVEESEELKLGIKCLVKDEDVVGLKEMKAKQAERRHRERSRNHHHRQRDKSSETSSASDVREKIVYRYIKVEKSAPSSPEKQKTSVPATSPDAKHLMSGALPPGDATETMAVVKVSTGGMAEATAKAPPRSHRSAAGSVKAREPSNSHGGKVAVSVKSSKSSPLVTSLEASSDKKRDYSESEIRVFARDEVERYRHAERKLDAHPEAFARGRVVPVEHRVDVERETVRSKPWSRPSIEAAKQEPPKAWEQASTQMRRPQPVPVLTSASSRREPADNGARWSEPQTSASTRKHSIDERATTASVKGTNHSSIEDSRYWYRSAGHGEPPESRSSGHVIRPEESVTWAVRSYHERDRTPQPESDPPISAKLLEVRGEIREAGCSPPVYRVQRDYQTVRPDATRGPPPPRMGNIVEVIEEVELPPRPRRKPEPAFEADYRRSAPLVSDRVKELKEDYERQEHVDERTGRAMSTKCEASVKMTGPLEQGFREGDAAAQSASRQSSKHTVTYASPREAERKIKIESGERQASRDLSVPSKATASGQFLTMPSPRKYAPRPSDDESWYASRVDSFDIHRVPNEKDQRPRMVKDDRAKYPEATQPRARQEDDDRTVYPREEAPRPELSAATRSPRSAREDDREYLYTERIVQPADRPYGSRPFDDAPPEYYYESTEHHTRSARGSKDWRPSNEAPSAQNPPPRTKASGQAPPPKRSSLTPPGHGRRGPNIQNGDESARVRFASKVDFSPTPPGSGEHVAIETNRKRRQVDGHESPGKGGEQSAHRGENEHRGRTRGRAPEEERSDYVYERESARVPERDREAESDRRRDHEESQSHHHRRYLQRHEHDAPSSHSDGTHGERHHHHDDDETASRHHDHLRGLARAMSESPSREHFLAEQRWQKEHEHASRHK